MKPLTQRAPHGARIVAATSPHITIDVPAEYDNQAAETAPATVHVAPAGNRKQRRKAAALARKR